MRSLLLVIVLAFATNAHAAPSSNPYEGTIELKLSTERLDAAHKAYDGVLARYKHGQARLDDVFTWSVRWLEAELVPEVGADTTRAIADHAARMHDLEAGVAAQYKRGLATSADVAMAQYYRVDADMRVQWNAVP